MATWVWDWVLSSAPAVVVGFFLVPLRTTENPPLPKILDTSYSSESFLVSSCPMRERERETQKDDRRIGLCGIGEFAWGKEIEEEDSRQVQCGQRG